MLSNDTKERLRKLVRDARSTDISTGSSLMEVVALTWIYGFLRRRDGGLIHGLERDPALQTFFQNVTVATQDHAFLQRLGTVVTETFSPEALDDPGEAYDYLLDQAIYPELEVSTVPRPIAILMAALLDTNHYLCDATCGRGELLAAAADLWRWTSNRPAPLRFNAFGHPLGLEQVVRLEQAHGSFFAFCQDKTQGRQAIVRLMLRGVPPDFIEHLEPMEAATEAEGAFNALVSRSFGPDTAADVRHVDACLRMLQAGGRAVLLVPELLLHNMAPEHVDWRRDLLHNHGVRAAISLGPLLPRQRRYFALLVLDKGLPTHDVLFYQDRTRYHRDKDERRSTEFDYWDLWLQAALALGLQRPPFISPAAWERWLEANAESPHYAEARMEQNVAGESLLADVIPVPTQAPRTHLVDFDTIRQSHFSLHPVDHLPPRHPAEILDSPEEMLQRLLDLETEITEGLETLRTRLRSI